MRNALNIERRQAGNKVYQYRGNSNKDFLEVMAVILSVLVIMGSIAFFTIRNDRFVDSHISQAVSR